MPIIQQRDREAVRQRLDAGLRRDVKITLFTRDSTGLYIPGRDCKYCGPTQELIEEVSSLSRRIRLKVVDFFKERETAAASGVKRIPATVIDTGHTGRVRFYGMPSGFEFAALIDTIIAASAKRSALQPKTRRRLKLLEEDVHIQVFVTPGCQYCPALARLAHAMALESPKVSADVVEIQEFPDLAGIYQVRGVPKAVINDRVQFTGAVPEEVLLKRVLQAVGVEEKEDGEVSISHQVTPVA
jgi:glutaredoxin-like protein